MRIKEVRKVCDYLGCDTDWNAIEQICTDQFMIAADLFKSKVFLSDLFVSELIRRIVREKWIFDMESAEYLLPFDISYFQKYYEHVKSYICDDPKILSAIPIQLEYGFSYEKALNPVRRLHYLSWIMQNKCECNESEFCCMLDYMEGGCDFEYGQIYISLLRIIRYIIEINEKYISVSVQDKVIWTYIWADKLYDEITAQIHSGSIVLNTYQNELDEFVKQIVPNCNSIVRVETLDVIDPSQMDITRICLLGSIELSIEFYGRDRDSEIQHIIGKVGEKLGTWIKSYNTLYEIMISHEKGKNEWNTFFNKNYQKEMNRLQITAFHMNENALPSETNQEYIQKILDQDSVSETDKSIILIECIGGPDYETSILLESFIQKFFLDSDIMSELNDYILAAVVLLRLPKEASDRLKKAIYNKAEG